MFSMAIVAALLSPFPQPPVQVSLQPVSFKRVKINDSFWSPRQRALDDRTMRQQFEMLDKHGYRSNFERASKRLSGGYIGFVFNDSDVYKVLEAGAFVLGRKKDAWLDAKMDEWIGLLAAAQEPSGYLNTHFQLMAPDQKWKNLRDQHELYCAGHLFEAAAAHFEATGKRNLLDVALKFANHIDATFGPGKRMGYPGHPEIELGLFKLAKVTGDTNWIRISEFMIENRGSKFFATEHGTPIEKFNGEYWNDHAPVRTHTEIVGHAVRAVYLYSGVADLAAQRNDSTLKSMLERVWRNTTEKRMFITGGLGPSGSNEGFTTDYDLPTFTAYQESCASIANALWNHRLNLLMGSSKYADVMETALYNGSMAGINLKGDRYFYTNPLASHGDHHRPEWHACACCPPNLARLIGQVGGLIYAASEDSVYVNLYVAGAAQVRESGQDVDLEVKTEYPWDGRVTVEIKKVGKPKFRLRLRQPGWLTSRAKIDGKVVSADTEGYINVDRTWKAGEKLVLELPMEPRRVVSHPSVKDTFGMMALARGPLYYCVEGVDNAFDLDRAGLPLSATITAEKRRDPALGSLVVLKSQAVVSPELTWKDRLFQTESTVETRSLVAVPYSMWDNRAPGEMRVWLKPNPEPSPLRGMERGAAVAVSDKSGYSNSNGVIDGYVPVTSNPNSPQQTHFWPKKGGEVWIQLSFKSLQTVSQSRVFWFDDTGRGEVRVPQSWRIEAWVSGAWVPVRLNPSGAYGVKLDVWNEVSFAPVKTDRLRMVIVQPEKWATGVHEWQVF